MLIVLFVTIVYRYCRTPFQS